MINTKNKRLISLSWELLEHKCKYYKNVGGDPVEDQYYDNLEEEYKYLCSELKIDPNVTNMVGFDMNRPSCKLVFNKLIRKKNERI